MKHKAVITYYKEPFESSDAYQSCVKNLNSKFEIVIIVNGVSSDEVYSFETHGKKVTVYQFKENHGLRAFQRLSLHDTDQDFVLLLNPDCKFGDVFTSFLDAAIQENTYDVIVPSLTCREKHISPFKKFNHDTCFYVYAYTCVRSAILSKVNQIPDHFFVDGIDYFLSLEFKRLNAHIRKIDVTIEHNLAVATDFQTLSHFRKNLIIESERQLLNLVFATQPVKKFVMKNIFIFRLKVMMFFKSLKS